MTLIGFENRSLDEVCRGIYPVDSGQGFDCLICGAQFESGRVYDLGGALFEAEKAALYHVELEHGGMLNTLLDLDKKDHGLTENQKAMVRYFVQGLTDAEIANATQISRSTVRNYRFALRERAKQAKIFLAIWNLVDRQTPSAEQLIPFPPSTTMRDDRLLITEKENREMIRAYFDKSGRKLLHFPRKQKKKAAILRHIMKHFSQKKQYTEKEINEILKEIHPDFVTIRRYLFDYGFLDREKNGSRYWVKNEG